MAMTKKEKLEFEDLKKDAVLARALRWTIGAVSPDLPVPSGEEVSVGWTFNAHSRQVMTACSASNTHALNISREEFVARQRTRTQQGIELYSTKILALKALRRSLENEFAAALLLVDMKIERELVAETLRQLGG